LGVGGWVGVWGGGGGGGGPPPPTPPTPNPQSPIPNISIIENCKINYI